MILARSILRVAAGLVLAATLHAAATLDGIRLGEPVSGPAVTAGDLAGKVVLFDYWGVNCGPCLAAIPHLAELRAKYGDDLVIIANHCQNATADKARAVWTGRGGGTAISVINGGDLRGSDVTGIPRCFLFDHTGALVFDGQPDGLAAPLAKAMDATPGSVLVGADISRFPGAVAALKSGGPLGPLLKQLRAAAASDKDALAQTQAKELLVRFGRFADNGMQAVDAARSDDPAGCARLLVRWQTRLKGDELAKPFDAKLKELTADKAFAKEVRAGEALSGIKAAAAKIGLGSDPDAFRRKPAVKAIATDLAALLKNFPDTRAAAQAKELAVAWGLSGDGPVR